MEENMGLRCRGRDEKILAGEKIHDVRVCV